MNNEFNDFTFHNGINSTYYIERYYKAKEEVRRKENERYNRVIHAVETIVKNTY